MANNIQKKQIDSERRIISYYVGGKKDSERSLLFFNGLYVGNESWIKQQRYPYFSQNYKLIFLDYPGVGCSVEKEEKKISFDDVVDAIKNILDIEECKKTNLIGYSVGGMFGIWLTFRYPERIESLVLLNSGVSINIHIEKMIEALAVMLEEKVSLDKIFMFLYPWNHSEEYLEKAADMQENTLRNYAEYNKNTRSFRLLLESIKNRPKLADVLINITVPTLIITGEKDKIFPLIYQKELAAGIKNNVHVSIPDSGHASFIEKYQEVNQLIQQHLQKLAY
jgi:pimeloyl-ACP methyl ester carboxylesterase